MRRLLPLLSSLGFVVGLSAQHVTTVSAVGVRTTAPGTPTQVAGVGPGVYVGLLNLTTSPSGSALNGAVLIVSAPSGPPLGTTTRFQSHVLLADTVPRSAGTTTAGTGAGPYGPVTFLLRYVAAAGRVGQLRLISTGVSSVSPSITTLVNQVTIDVNADGTPEFTSPSSQVVVPVVFPASGEILVHVTLDNHATGTGFIASQSTTDVIMSLEPVMIAPYGAGCGGATSTATTSGLVLTPNGATTVTLASSGGFPNAPVVSAFGASNIGPTLPGGCALLTDASILVPFVSDGAGTATHAFELHATVAGLLYHQFVSVDLATFAFRTSNGLAITAW